MQAESPGQGPGVSGPAGQIQDSAKRGATLPAPFSPPCSCKLRGLSCPAAGAELSLLALLHWSQHRAAAGTLARGAAGHRSCPASRNGAGAFWGRRRAQPGVPGGLSCGRGGGVRLRPARGAGTARGLRLPARALKPGSGWGRRQSGAVGPAAPGAGNPTPLSCIIELRARVTGAWSRPGQRGWMRAGLGTPGRGAPLQPEPPALPALQSMTLNTQHNSKSPVRRRASTPVPLCHRSRSPPERPEPPSTQPGHARWPQPGDKGLAWRSNWSSDSAGSWESLYRVVLLGDPGVGKTSLVNLFAGVPERDVPEPLGGGSPPRRARAGGGRWREGGHDTFPLRA